MTYPKFTLKLTFETPKKARIIYESVYPEHSASQVRSKCKMDLFENSIIISCISDELSILKASIYSYIRWIKVAESIYKLTEDE